SHPGIPGLMGTCAPCDRPPGHVSTSYGHHRCGTPGHVSPACHAVRGSRALMERALYQARLFFPALLPVASERGGGLSPATVRVGFHRLYPSLKMDGCSSHSGRRTFITRAARRVSQVGGSLRDVQELAGHTSLAMTQRYIEGDTEAKRKLVALL